MPPAEEALPSTAALCAVHGQSAAVFTCKRCGAFACKGCRSSEEGLCLACDARLGDYPEGLDVAWLIREGAALFVSNLHMVFGFALASLAISTVFSMVLPALGAASGESVRVILSRAFSPAQLALLVVKIVTDLFFLVTCLAWWAAQLRGEKLTLGEALVRGGRRLLPCLGVRLVYAVCVAVGLFLCLIPGLFIAVAWSLALTAAALGAGPLEALGQSYGRTQGHRWKLGLVWLLVVMVGLLVSALTKSLMVLGAKAPALIYVFNGAGTVVGSVGNALWAAVSVIAFHRLSGERLPVRR